MEVKPDFPKQETEVLQYWRDNDTFQKTMKQNQDKPRFNFYEGPPFATGLPHYGHISAGTIKDVVTRFVHQTGHNVPRNAGWDVHGLPVEYEIDKLLGIRSKQDVLDMGIENYNKKCREIVMRYSSEWRETIERSGRWIDFDNDYKTMDMKFMESVWWVFKTLYNKGLIYRSIQIMPYSTTCNTPLSNFEVQQNYKQVTDPTATVAFQLRDYNNTYILAWTTTPWSLVGNLALAVNPKLEYTSVTTRRSDLMCDTAEQDVHFILLTSKVAEFFDEKVDKKDDKKDDNKVDKKDDNKVDKKDDNKVDKKDDNKVYNSKNNQQIIRGRVYKGSELIGMEYYPIFDFYQNSPIASRAFRILSGDFVSDESGTGIVHIAPAFGENDYNICLENNILTSIEVEQYCPVDPNGKFTSEVGSYKGMYFKDADKQIISDLKSRTSNNINNNHGFIFKTGYIHHQYPYCWRSQTPLMYRAMSGWYLDVPKIKERLITNSMSSYWIPEHIQSKRFLNWLENVRPWNISRNRFWGNPIPVWANEDFSEVIVVGSIQELENLTQVEPGSIKDLHRESIDHLTIPSHYPDKPPLRRIDEIFDCWWESASMPYAQFHYPFENRELIENSGFPADFIAEGLDQTRGWFYTLMVISTALFDKPAFKNLIVNGIVLADDGKKMSKSLKNYPEPTEILDKHGADALRLYLINSPVVRAESLLFSENGVKNIVKSVLIPWFNAVRFFIQNVNQDNFFIQHSTVGTYNSMDYWIYHQLSKLRIFVVEEMKNYHLYTIVPAVTKFLDNLNNTYIRFNRLRLKGEVSLDDQTNSIRTLYHTLFIFGKIMAPFTPFASEYFYQQLNAVSNESQEHSIHMLDFPSSLLFSHINGQYNTKVVDLLVELVETCRGIREKKGIPLRIPLSKLIVYTELDLSDVKQYIMEELNIKELIVTDPIEEQISLTAKPNYKNMGQRLNHDSKRAIKIVSTLTTSQIKDLEKNGEVIVNNITLQWSDISSVVKKCINPDPTIYTSSIVGVDVVVLMNCVVTPELQLDGDLRTFYSTVKQLRKKAGLSYNEVAIIYSNASFDIVNKLKESYNLKVEIYKEGIPFTFKDQIIMTENNVGYNIVNIYL